MAKVSRLVPPRAAQILGECHKLTSERLTVIVKGLLDKTDDQFFEIANKADTSLRQQIYFDSMRELRLKRGVMERDFFASLQSEFDGCFTPYSKPGPAFSLSESGFELALVGTDDVEESLAVTNFTEALSTRCKQELFGLDQRIGHLLSDPQLAHAKNPFGPTVLGGALRAAGKHLETGIEARLTLYKITDRISGVGLHELYRALNELLVREDVLPRLSSGIQRNEGVGPRTRVTIETESGSTEIQGQDVFSTLQQLMRPGGLGVNGISSNIASGPVQAMPFAGGVPSTGGFPSLNGEVMGSSETQNAGMTGVGSAPMTTASFVNTLTQWQHATPDGHGLAGAFTTPAENGNVLRALRHSGAVGELNQTDNLTLDIVTLLFDYILDDPSIPDKIKALIGRLQIPLLKVALLDKELFSKKTHPARQLLDALAAAAVGWSDGTRHGDALYEKIQYIVYRVVEEFERDFRLFAELLAELNSFLTEDARSASRHAELATKSLRTQERIVIAKLAVDEVVKDRLKNTDVREFVQQFVRDYWRQLLIVTHVEAGTSSDLWRQQVAVIDDLAWSVQPKTSPDEKRELTTRLPKMLTAIKAGMRELNMAPKVCSKFLSMLASVHVVSVKNVEEASLAERRIRQREAETAEAVTQQQTEEQFVKQALERLFERKSIDAAELDIDFSALESSVVANTDILPEPPPAEDEFLEKVMMLDLGDWLEFTGGDGEPVRARFTWLSPATGRYLFTDRQGRKTFDLTLNNLAEQFREQAVTRVESQPDPIFERAIGELMERLDRCA